MKKKRHYSHPATTPYVLDSADSVLLSFSVSHSENASENDNPQMDTKASGEWDDVWEN
jgi:hypothetical protein